ncbi:MAG TPA: FTR1 family protein, partial [Chloroflexota bacterium]|nr:FTR1 family protein [Chloroflexota bacterium]
MNLAAAVLTFREGLEAALIIAIVLTYLRRTGRAALAGQVWLGAGVAAALTALFIAALQALGATFDYPAQGIFEGVTSLLAVAMVTTMTFWMARQGRAIKGALEEEVEAATAGETATAGAGLRRWGLFGVAFLAVGREGVETGLFLAAAAFASSGLETLVGGIVGLVVSAAVAVAVYVAGLRLNLRAFFRASGVLLVFFGAAMLRYAVHEFEEVGLVPPLVERVWDTGAILPDGEGPGAVLAALVGYTAHPSLAQVIAYVAYFAVVLLAVVRPWAEREPRGQSLASAAPRAAATAVLVLGVGLLLAGCGSGGATATGPLPAGA